MKRESSSADASGTGKAPVKVILFDAAGTLIYLSESVGWHYSLVAARHGLSLDETRLNQAFLSAWKEMPAREATKEQRPDDDKGWWRTLVGRVLEKVAPEAGSFKGAFDFNACFEDIYFHFAEPGVWHLYPDAAILTSLHRSYRLAIVSNFDRRLFAILDHLGISGLFEKIIISSEVGADKPDPYIFQHALTSLGVNPSNTLYVGDDPAKDWLGAETAGMRVFRLDRSKNSLIDLPGSAALQ